MTLEEGERLTMQEFPTREAICAIKVAYEKNGIASNENSVIEDNRALLDCILQEAQFTGAFIEDISPFIDKKLAEGSKSQIYLSKRKTHVIKITTIELAANDFTEFLRRTAAHNKHFPDTYYRILGFSRDNVGRPAVILLQPYVQSSGHATYEQIEKYMLEHGFKRVLKSK